MLEYLFSVCYKSSCGKPLINSRGKSCNFLCIRRNNAAREKHEISRSNFPVADETTLKPFLPDDLQDETRARSRDNGRLSDVDA